MRYAIMKQIDANTWTSSLDSSGLKYIYVTLVEAQTKLEELEANNPTNISYMIESYPNNTDI